LETGTGSIDNIGIATGYVNVVRKFAGGHAADASWAGRVGDIEDLETGATKVSDVGIATLDIN
jgi:hypothetical protein